MFTRLLFCLLACMLCSCISFNSGAKLDSIGKAEPVRIFNPDGPFYKLNGVVYKETMVEYMQLRPRLVGRLSLYDTDTREEPVPADEATGAPAPELYLVRMDARRTESPTFIRAIDFDYVKAERIEKGKVHPFIPLEYFKHNDPITLMPTLYDNGDRVFSELPTYRTLGNKLRMPISAVLTYGVDLPLTAAGYLIGALILSPLGL